VRYGSKNTNSKQQTNKRVKARLRPSSRLVYVTVSVATVVTEHTTERSTETDEEGSECADSEPVGISILCLTTVIADVLTGDTKEHHGDDPDYEGTEGGEGGEKGHEDCARAVVRRTTETKKNSETRKGSSDRV